MHSLICSLASQRIYNASFAKEYIACPFDSWNRSSAKSRNVVHPWLPALGANLLFIQIFRIYRYGNAAYKRYKKMNSANSQNLIYSSTYTHPGPWCCTWRSAHHQKRYSGHTILSEIYQNFVFSGKKLRIRGMMRFCWWNRIYVFGLTKTTVQSK